MTRTRDNIIASAHGMPIASERKDETAMFERIKRLEAIVASLLDRVTELEAGKGM